MKLVTVFALSSALAASACGTLGNADASGTLDSVSGSISNPSAVSVEGGAFRVALVWDTSGQLQADGSYADDRRTTQDVAVTPAFPAEFRLDLTKLPDQLQPYKEMFGVPGGGTVDLQGVGGLVVAYEDLNHNGKLDLVTSADTAYVDRVLGQSTSNLVYFEGTMPSDLGLMANSEDAEGFVPSLGFNLFQTFCATGKTPPKGRDCDTIWDWASASTPIAIELSAKPELALLMCAELPSGAEVEHDQAHNDLPAKFPSPTDANLQCGPDGKTYTYKTCTTTTPPGICQPSTTTCVGDTYQLAPGATAPAGWPCSAH